MMAKMATPEDQAWLEEFNRGRVYPQPAPFPTVSEMAEIKLREIDREIGRLQEERSWVLKRTGRR